MKTGAVALRRANALGYRVAIYVRAQGRPVAVAEVSKARGLELQAARDALNAALDYEVLKRVTGGLYIWPFKGATREQQQGSFSTLSHIWNGGTYAVT